MSKRIISVSVSEWSADDIDYFERFISSTSKQIETCNYLTDIEMIDSYLEKVLNIEPPALCGHWGLLNSALRDGENVIEIFVILSRVRLMPDKDGMVNFIKWSKE